jgi:ribosomal protein S18 acetylase RimI-like enzyme
VTQNSADSVAALMVSTNRISVRPVKGRRDLERFIRVPFWLHQHEPMWVPPLMFERRRFLNKKKNPFFNHGDAEYFLCERDGEIVGRITAQFNEHWDAQQGGSDGMFGFFECQNDQAAAAALVNAAREWLTERGRERMLGPMDFTTNDECGLLIDAYDQPPIVLTLWQPPYYLPLLESTGMTKAMDVQMWSLILGEMHADSAGRGFSELVHKAAALCEGRNRVTVRNMRRRDLKAEMGRFMEVYNAAWSENWGFVPLTEDEVAFQVRNLKPILDEDWAFVAERDGEVLGAGLTLPDINQVLAKMGGRLLPLGWLQFLLGRRKIDRVRVFALGVKPEYRHLGIDAALYVKHLEAGISEKNAVWWGETGWVLENNRAMNKGMVAMGGKVTRRYRIFELAL